MQLHCSQRTEDLIEWWKAIDFVVHATPSSLVCNTVEGLHTRNFLSRKALSKRLHNILQFRIYFLGDLSLLVDRCKEIGLVVPQVRQEVCLPLKNLSHGHIVEMPIDTCVDKRNHLIDGHWLVLLLLEQLGQTLTTIECLLRGGIKIRTELGEGGNLTILCQEEFEGPSDLFHCLQLSCGTDTGD